MDKNREIAIEIIDVFEDILSTNNILLPDSCRNDDNIENQASIYGETYFNLEDSITDILDKKLNSNNKKVLIEIIKK